MIAMITPNAPERPRRSGTQRDSGGAGILAAAVCSTDGMLVRAAHRRTSIRSRIAAIAWFVVAATVPRAMPRSSAVSSWDMPMRNRRTRTCRCRRERAEFASLPPAARSARWLEVAAAIR